MSHIATLVAAAPALLDNTIIAQASRALGCAPAPAWLAEGQAADLACTVSADVRDAAASVRRALGGAAVDVIVQPAAGRRKKLLLADMDSTMIGQECIDELAAFAGLKDHVAAITERAMRGDIAFEPALRERVALLKGLPVSTVDAVMEKHITLTRGGGTLVATMRAHGAHTALVSGGFTLFTSRVAALLGFDDNRANILLAENGCFTGLVAEPILGREAKRDALLHLSAQHGVHSSDSMAVGDGANDLAMLAAAGMGYAFHAKPSVAEAAAARVDHGDLTVLLFAQGYRRDEFVVS